MTAFPTDTNRIEDFFGRIQGICQEFGFQPEITPTTEPVTSLEMASRIYNFRRERDRHFGTSFFSDPAWDILLDLFIQRKKGKSTSITSACIAACVAATTALRWISVLEKKGLVVRVADAKDMRRTFVSLTDGTFEMMERMLTPT